VHPLRRMPTTRLVALIAGAALAGGGGAAIAASVGGASAPPPEPLAQALHGALAAPAVQGVTARISFTNHLVDASSLPEGDPILSGATGRLWADGDGRLRLELQSERGDAQVLLDGRTLSVYDPGSSTVYRLELPATSSSSGPRSGVPSVARIQRALTRLMGVAAVSGADPGTVAGRPAYTVSVAPKHDGGLLGHAELAWDAAHGVPLRIAVYATDDSSPVLELKATDISFGPVPASDLAVQPPPGTRVVRLTAPATGGGGNGSASGSPGPTGVAAVAAAAPFPLAAPTTLVGLPRHDVRLVRSGGARAALVTYGRGLGGIAVIERAAPAAGGGGAPDLGAGLPSISIDGASGRELATALGTALQFTRAGVQYTVLGSVPPMAAEAAARALP
jgi:outer membrane lipoprotein-sorting protein